MAHMQGVVRSTLAVAVAAASLFVVSPSAAAGNACVSDSEPANDSYNEQGTGDYKNWHPVLTGAWGEKTAKLMSGRLQDDSYGEFTKGYDSETDRIWIQYRRPGEDGEGTKCGPRSSRKSPHIDTFDPVRREVKVCIETKREGNTHSDCADMWWTDNS